MRKVIAIVEKDKCHPDKCQHECMKYDPVNKSGGEGFHLGLSGKSEIADSVVMEVHKICAKKCPFQAIHIINLPDRLKEDPIHKYGANSFELYSLPIVKPNTIVGIIGRNGIGKSTALQILTGTIKPNLGKYKDHVKEDEIIKKYSNVWIGDYFKRLLKKETKIAYKPQRVELILQAYKNHKVCELLEKIDERGVVNNLLDEFNIHSIIDRRIDELSGGELQKIAIIATAARNADVYYFDEPSSFLDIVYRIKAAKIIRSLAEHASVVVVEHDLATLDYISDEIQIVYGEQACYGIFSNSKSVRRGINDYMEGMLPEENIKFRPYSIIFKETPVDRITSKEVAVEFPELEKKYESFNLKTNAGEMHKGEVLCIMGANGLGKSTFLKLLAGVEKPDKGKINSINISYKSQYLDYNIEETVGEYLKKICGEEFSSGWFKTHILEKLNIQAILNNKIPELSGGEIQKVHIVACLLKPGMDLVAMDEPSAFIDIEDRLNIAEIIKDYIIKNNISALIVDHDIQFLDHLSDKILVFEGIPGKEGYVAGPLSKKDGMNRFLKKLEITYRRDKSTGRPRINKPGSQLDKEQRNKNNYYYT